MTNKEALQTISDLKNEIDSQKLLCSNLIKLSKVDHNVLIELQQNILQNIDNYKKYQGQLIQRNSECTLTHNNKSIIASELIRRKEALLLKKDFELTLVSIETHDEDILKVSLEAFQNVQKYKKEIAVILQTLNNYNNQEW